MESSPVQDTQISQNQKPKGTTGIPDNSHYAVFNSLHYPLPMAVVGGRVPQMAGGQWTKYKSLNLV